MSGIFTSGGFPRRNAFKGSGKARTAFDVVNWEMLVAPGVIGCRDGSLIAGWEVTGIDTETMEEVAIEAWQDQLADGLSSLEEGEALRLVRKRRKWKPGTDTSRGVYGGGKTAGYASGKPDGDASGKPDGDIGRHGGAQGKQSDAVQRAAGEPAGGKRSAAVLVNGGRPAGLALGNTAADQALAAMFMEQEAVLSTPGYLWTDTITLYYHRSQATGMAAITAATSANFEDACRTLEDRLGGVLGLRRLGPVRMDEEGRFGAPWTSCSLTGSLCSILGLPERPVRIDPAALPLPLDHLIDIDLEQQHFHGPGRIDNRPTGLMTLRGYHAKGDNTGALAQVQSLPLEFTWVVTYGALSPITMRERTRRKQKYLRQGAADMGADIIGENEGRRDRVQDRAAENLEDALDRVSSGETAYGQYNTYMLVTGEPDDEDHKIGPAVRQLTNAVRACGLELRRETVNFLPALLAMLPGHEDHDVRAFEISAHAVTGLMPLRSLWRGEPTNPSPLMKPGTPALLRARSQTGELVNFNLHCGDLGHGLIFGPTGAGKSVLLGLLAAAFLRYPNAQVIYFDRQRSIAHACAALGGVFMEPGGDGPAGIAPLAHMHELGRDWAINWVETLVRMQGVEPDDEMLKDLHKAVNNSWRLEERPAIDGLLSYVQFRQLRNALNEFVGEGPYGQLFSQDLLFNKGKQSDAVQGGFAASNQGGSPRQHNGGSAADNQGGFADDKEGGSADQRQAVRHHALSASGDQPAFSVFETHALLEAKDIVRVLSLDYIFAQVQRRFDSRPTLVVFDEAWSFFGHELFTERIRSWLKEGRKNNVSVLMATQSLTDAIRSELTSDLMESCPTKIYLPNAQAETESSFEHYRALGLTVPEIAQIARMRPKRDYYVTQPQGRRVLSFPIGHLGLSIIGRTSARDSRRAAEAGNNRSGRPHPDFWKEGLDHAFEKMGADEETRETPAGGAPTAGTLAAKRDKASQGRFAQKRVAQKDDQNGQEAQDDPQEAAE